MPEKNWLHSLYLAQQGNSGAASDATRVARRPALPKLPDNVARPVERDPLRFVPQPFNAAAKAAKFLATGAAAAGRSARANLEEGLQSPDAKSAALPLAMFAGETALNLLPDGGVGEAVKGLKLVKNARRAKKAVEEVVAVASKHGETGRIFTHAAHPMAQREAMDVGLSGYFNDGYLVAAPGQKPRFVDRKTGEDVARAARQKKKGTPVGSLRSEYLKNGMLSKAIGEFDADPTDALAKKMFDDLNTGKGFSYNAKGDNVSEGFAVGAGNEPGNGVLQVHENDLSVPMIADFLRKHPMGDDALRGGWVDEKGNVFIEPSTHVMDNAEAMRLGRTRGEKAVGDLGMYARGEDGTLPVTFERRATGQQADAARALFDQNKAARANFNATANEVRQLPSEHRASLIHSLKSPDPVTTLPVPERTVTHQAQLLRRDGMHEAAANLEKFMEGSVVRKPVFHGTRSNFDSFAVKDGDIGVHVGTPQQAASRITATITDGRGKFGPGATMPLWASVKSPVRMKDPGDWNGDRLENALNDIDPELTTELADNRAFDLTNSGGMSRALRSAGVDGVVYKNAHEIGETPEILAALEAEKIAGDEYFGHVSGRIGAYDNRGSAEQAYRAAQKAVAKARTAAQKDSYAVLHPNQLKSVTGNSGAYDPAERSILGAVHPRVMGSIAGGGVGGLAGGTQGDTPEERVRNAALGAVAGAALPFAATSPAARRFYADESGALKTGWDKLPGGIPKQHDIPRVQPGKLVLKSGKVDEAEELAYKLGIGAKTQGMLRDANGLPIWYDAAPTYQSAVDVLGDEKGMSEAHRLMNNIAATTAMSTPPSNWKRGGLFHTLQGNNMVTPDELRSGKLVQVPEGFGHLVQRKTHQPALARVHEGGGVGHLDNQKPASFGGAHSRNESVRGNLGGNSKPVTIDEVMSTKYFRAMQPKLAFALGGGSPKDWAYAPIERGFQRAMEHNAGKGIFDVPDGMSPTSRGQELIWKVLNPESGGTAATVFDDLRNQSAGIWNVSPKKANEMFWRGEQPFGLELGKDWRGGLLDPKPYTGKR